ncbi:GNAT family N-acetyltransferase [Rhizobium straminoryzae]|uniref:GNAT family N-acetyltransferase n=1 Tax=Rhizobium straminoryzae TaxID=1387186 RepID=A0A549T6L6_9HYPH|nr:GNAT family N-acetyltransferase [Rhizobium straminoryzae]TRL37480.1 GNAT family N-acetyltransferase [Rhizobium straminoryzae]
MTQDRFPIASDARWPEGLIIRVRTPVDAEGIAALHNLPGYRFGTLRTPYHSADDIRKGIEGQPATVTALVAILGEQIVGDIGLTRFASRRAHAGSIGMGVHDRFTGRGIGRALLGEIVSIADNWLNLRRLELTVYTDNAPAVALYRRFGFAVEGTLQDFAFRDGAFVDAHTMARVRR